MKKKHYLLLLLMLTVGMGICTASCGRSGARIPATDGLHRVANSVYYWRTVFNLSDEEQSFMARENIGRIYLRMFDVIVGDKLPVPDATVRFDQHVPDNVEIVPTTFITVDAIRGMKDDEDIQLLAKKIVDRIDHICNWNEITNWHEIQLDCDWTEQTRDRFFRLCKLVREALPEDKLLSSTIRLHQLRQKEPPVDYGVLMVYNTDNFQNPYVTNSILNDSTVEEYLEQRLPFRLPLDIALPIYRWNLIFDQDGHFRRIASDWDHAEDEVMKFESVPFATLQRTQQLLNEYLHLQSGRHSTVLYHLDDKNIKDYSHEEIKNLYDN